MLEYGMTQEDINKRKEKILQDAKNQGLLDYNRLIDIRILDREHQTICPLCLEKLSATGFLSKMMQAFGRDTPDTTITPINLFHLKELISNEYNHCPYNVGWGHHHCNVVIRDHGIEKTLVWMEDVIERNKNANQVNDS